MRESLIAFLRRGFWARVGAYATKIREREADRTGGKDRGARPEASPAILFEGHDAGLDFRCTEDRGSGVLVVVFSQVRVPGGHFGLSRLFAKTRHASLFLNQPQNDWYRGVESCVDQAIHRAMALSGTHEMVLYGSSMGAFGALAASSRWPDARTIAFAPDFAIGEAGSQSAAKGLTARVGDLDLSALLQRRGRGAPVDIIAGVFDPYDAGTAARLNACTLPDSVRIIPVRSSHEVHDHFYTANVIRRIIGGFNRSVPEAIADRGLLVAHPDYEQLARFAHYARSLAAGDPPAPSAVRALDPEGSNLGIRFLAAQCLAVRGDLPGAEAALAAIALDLPQRADWSSLPKRFLKEIPRRRIALLKAIGDEKGLRAVAREAAEAYPADSFFTALACGRL